MYLNFLESSSTDVWIQILTILLAIVGIAIGVMVVVAYFLRWSIIIKYRRYNRQTNKAGLTGEQAARLLLDNLGMNDVKVEKAGIFTWLFFGNSYSRKYKAIRLRGNICNKQTITAVGLATQKVGLAIQDKNNDKKFETLYSLRIFSMFAPILFIPICLMGLLIDVFVFGDIGWLSLVGAIFGGIYYILSFIVLMFTISVERKACNSAMEMMEKTNFLDEEERYKINDVYNTYIKAYIVDFIIEILYIIKFILKLVLNILKAKANDN